MRKTPSVSSEDRNGVENDENSVATGDDDADLEEREGAAREHDAPLRRRAVREEHAEHEEDRRPGMNPYVRASGERHAMTPSAASEAAPAPTTSASERAGQHGADLQHEPGVGQDEHREREQRAEVLADEVLAAAHRAGQDREDRLLLELSVQRRRADDDRDRDAEERDRRDAEVADDPRPVAERVGADDDRVERDREGDAREADEDARPKRFPVGVEGDRRDAAEHRGDVSEDGGAWKGRGSGAAGQGPASSPGSTTRTSRNHRPCASAWPSIWR